MYIVDYFLYLQRVILMGNVEKISANSIRVFSLPTNERAVTSLSSLTHVGLTTPTLKQLLFVKTIQKTLEGKATCRLHRKSPKEYNRNSYGTAEVNSVFLAIGTGQTLPKTAGLLGFHCMRTACRLSFKSSTNIFDILQSDH